MKKWRPCLWAMVFGRPADLPEIAPGERQSLREQIHQNRNEVSKTIAVARLTEHVSQEAEETLRETGNALRGSMVRLMRGLRGDDQ